jgi:acyl dehydratase
VSPRLSDDSDSPALAQRGWWLEDVRPGTTIRHPGGRTLTGGEHARLAWLTDNASDLHGDAHRAALGAFGEPVVLGALSAAIVIGLAGPATGPAGAAFRTIRSGWARIALTAVVRAGDTLLAASTFRTVRPDPDGLGGIVERTIEGRNQRGEVVLIVDEERWVPSRNG